MAIQGGLGIICSFVIFPESVGHAFQSKLTNILIPLDQALQSISALFSETTSIEGHLAAPEDHDKVIADRLESWAAKGKAIRAELLKSLAGVPPCRAQQRYLAVDFSYSRLSGNDLRDIFDLLAAVQTRSGGMAFFFDVLVNNARHAHLDSSAFSVHQASHSRPGSVRDLTDLHGHQDDDSDHQHHESPNGHDAHDAHNSSSFTGKRYHLPNFLHRRSGSPAHGVGGHKGSHMSLLDSLRKAQHPVGVYESQRYMDVERVFGQ
jgi:hypothetical protein